ncbi:putative DNA binding domain-containing protein [Sphingomonas sanguinis]|uniref:ATP-binding protein n=1 Tax=Sphingomonas sanguinis TaxID=33051 RepID=UPI001C59DA40|nr:ATP-binding protein [Sphingomonas sanguinis]QXT35390.1 putative DNA binding domain-containing protein [Sphingomonas sanguinis]
MTELLEDVIDRGRLPPDTTAILPYVTEPDGHFLSREGPLWDFKGGWPTSYSDSYFHGLCRLICAFANTNGGLVVFGVDDKARTGARARLVVDIDRFAQAFAQLVGSELKVDFKHYESPSMGHFAVMLIPPLDVSQLPIRFKGESRFYPSGTIWVRQGHQVVTAEPRHVAQLYCRTARDDNDEPEEIDGALPPSPATIRQFVGRIATIDRLFDWLKTSDQPRNFLHGKGGSGKSTIAFQVAKVLRDSGAGFLIEGEEPLEKVMFLTGKERELDPGTQAQKGVVYTDFKDERTLYEAILTEGGSDFDNLDDLSMIDLKNEVANFFHRTSSFIVIDDIDTLTTKGLEAGFEFLIGALYKARKRSRILYTLRNAPSQALSNSIDVPGLNDAEYLEFVNLASAQFGVDPPSGKCRDEELSSISERRPLVIESVIALRRRTDSYERALELFKSGGGDDVRGYVFRREWDSISPASRGRELLALLALYKGKISYEDIIALMYDNAAIVPDAMAEVQEMFLQVEREGERSLYRLNELTRAFVLEASTELNNYSALKTRVSKFVTNIYADSPELRRLLGRVERLLAQSTNESDHQAAQLAWVALMQAKSDALIREDPRFMAACGYAALHVEPPNIADAREYFQNSFAMRHGPDVQYVRAWFLAEQKLDGADHYTSLIYKLVDSAREYDDGTRLEFLSRRATSLYHIAQSGFYSDPEKSLNRLLEAIRLNAKGYLLTSSDNTKQAYMFERHFTTSAFVLKNYLIKAGRFDDLVTHLADLTKLPGAKLDPLLEPVREVAAAAISYSSPAQAQRAAGRMLHLGQVLRVADCWLDRAVRDQCVAFCFEAAGVLNKKKAGRL